MNRGVSNKLPICIQLHAGQGDVARSFHVGRVQPNGEVRQRGALHLHERAGVPDPHGKENVAVLVGPIYAFKSPGPGGARPLTSKSMNSML